MLAKFQNARRFVIHLLAAGLLASGLALAVAPGAGAAPLRAGHTIATAGNLTLGGVNSGGGGPVDFWRVKLLGGDQIQIIAKTPNLPCCDTSYYFDLFPPGTNDANFPQINPVMGTSTPGASSQSVIQLQAPYNGTFILAVCENVNGDCRNTDSGGGTNPMGAYTFTPSLIGGGVKASVGDQETRASTSIGKAPAMPIGHFEAGGGTPVDYWKVTLRGGDQVQITASTPYLPCCDTTYDFDLFPPGTNGTNFPQKNPVMTAVTPGASTKSVLTLQAPYNGTFLLAVCENVGNDCRNVVSGGGTNPIGPYTFTPTLIGGGVKAIVGAKETRAGITIAKAPLMPVGNFEAGGGDPVDFWKVHLFGGDRIQIIANTPYLPCCDTSYYFDLYKPGTTDTNFPQNPPVFAAVTPGASTKSTLDIQAPSTGTFVLAVCENVSGDCRNTDSGGGTNPMNVYTYTDTLVGGRETRTVLFLSAMTIIHGSEKKLVLSVHVTARFSGHPRGKVSISAGKKHICTLTLNSRGKGSCSPGSNTLLPVGTFHVVATYEGGRGLLSSTSGARTLKVKK